MPRKDKPYLPLYVQDVLTDERLINCSASTHGVYFRLLCILHKQETYGKILLKQKHKQSDKQIKNFALYISKQMPFSEVEILAGITELFDEGVIGIDGDCIFQKRMVNDYELSIKRAKSGGKGGKETQLKIKKFAKAKVKANPDIDIDIENDSDNVLEAKGKKFKLDEVGKLTELQIGSTQQLLKITKNVNYSEKDILGLWEVFKVQNITGKKYYESVDDIYSHFLNSLQTKNINGSQFNQSGNGKLGTSAARIEAAKKF